MTKHDCPNCKCESREYITITRDMDIKDRMKVQSALGRMMNCDIGKRVYFVNGHAQVENSEQFKRRVYNRVEGNRYRI